jgi:hypothetical protein
VAACDRFIFLEVLGRADDVPPDEGDATEGPPLPDLRRILTTAVETTSQDDGWSSLSSMANYLNNTHASFDPRNYGYSKLSALARAQDYLEVEQREGRSPQVRLTPQAAAPAPAKAPPKAAGRRTRKATQKTAAKKG